jgi:hypothetical protein
MQRIMALTLAAWLSTAPISAQVLDHQKLLDAQTFWDNRDWDWYKANIPFFECPDQDITTTYYYRWELVTKHLTYGSPNSGYSFTEFIDRPFWSGAYGAISCPAGLHLYEVRWLRDPRIARDYTRYWFRTPGAEPRRYSTWLADAAWAVHQVHPDAAFIRGLLPDLVKNYEGWEKEHFVPEVGMFWQTGHDDGMEYNINSRQTTDIVRGAPGYRPTLNSYLAADARAIAKVAALKGDVKTAGLYREKAASLKSKIQAKLWDPKRQFFYPMAKQDETANGHTVKALSLTYQTGQFAGDPHGRELIGYVPWQFNLLDSGKGYETAWKALVDKDRFWAEFGPTTVERKDPLFKISKTCCWWSGNSWPYATAQTLKALANLLQNYEQDAVIPFDYVKLLTTFAKTHRKDGKPYIAEASSPDTGSWEGHDSYNHSEHYFHSNFCDLVITGLVGLQTRDDDVLLLKPLAPSDWDYFALDNLVYRGRNLSILWDKSGTRYGKGEGLRVLADGKEIASSDKLGQLYVDLPAPAGKKPLKSPLINYAVNNDGDYFPKVSASYLGARSTNVALNDGNYWYHISPPNRWTAVGSLNDTDWCVIDFGSPRPLEQVKLYVLEDGDKIKAPAKIDLEYWEGSRWKAVPSQTRSPEQPTGHRANVIRFPELKASKVRALLTHQPGAKSGLSEFEAWGHGAPPIEPAPMPPGNLAYNPIGKGYPKATASFSDRFGSNPMSAIDGKVSFRPSPFNRWTSYESKNAVDWLEIDFGAEKEISRIELGIYDDHGGVQAPTKYEIEAWDGKEWKPVANSKMAPETPAGGQFNEVRFDRVKTGKVRIMFTNRGEARSGVTEVLVWKE